MPISMHSWQCRVEHGSNHEFDSELTDGLYTLNAMQVALDKMGLSNAICRFAHFYITSSPCFL